MEGRNKKAEEALRDYIRVIEKVQAEEMKRFMDDDMDAAEEKDKKTVEPFHKNKKNNFMRYAAVFIAVAVLVGIAAPVQKVSAWVIWKFDAIFGEFDDHTIINPNGNNDYIKYYVEKVPEGYELVSTTDYGNGEIIEYVGTDGMNIAFSQLKLDSYKSNLDNEHRKNHYEVINDFEVLVSEGSDDLIFEIITEETAMTIHTNDGYEVGKNFIDSLRKID